MISYVDKNLFDASFDLGTYGDLFKREQRADGFNISANLSLLYRKNPDGNWTRSGIIDLLSVALRAGR